MLMLGVLHMNVLMKTHDILIFYRDTFPKKIMPSSQGKYEAKSKNNEREREQKKTL